LLKSRYCNEIFIHILCLFTTMSIPLASSSNSVVVRFDPSTGFDTTYSLHLQSHMHPEEFHKAITRFNKINKTYQFQTRYLCFLWLLPVALAAYILTMIFGVKNHIWVLPVALVLFLVLSIVGISITVFFSVRRQRERKAALLELVADLNCQSLPRGIQWRLHQFSIAVGRGRAMMDYLEIELGQPLVCKQAVATIATYQEQPSTAGAPTWNGYAVV